MQDAREHVANVLRANLPADVEVIAYGRQADQPSKRRVTIVSGTVDPPERACPSRYASVVLTAVTPLTDPGPADDDLDELLDLVLDALDAGAVIYGTAQRGTWLDTHHAYELTCSYLTNGDHP